AFFRSATIANKSRNCVVNACSHSTLSKLGRKFSKVKLACRESSIPLNLSTIHISSVDARLGGEEVIKALEIPSAEMLAEIEGNWLGCEDAIGCYPYQRVSHRIHGFKDLSASLRGYHTCPKVALESWRF